MKLSTRGQYAVMAMVDIASQKCDMPISLTDIATRQSLPLAFLEQIFSQLRKRGLVKSIRGHQGGYVLALPACQIKILNIIQAVEEKIQTTRCSLQSTFSCQGKNTRCLTHDLWAGLEKKIGQYLESISLQDICKNQLSALTPSSVMISSSVGHIL